MILLVEAQGQATATAEGIADSVAASAAAWPAVPRDAKPDQQERHFDTPDSEGDPRNPLHCGNSSNPCNEDPTSSI